VHSIRLPRFKRFPDIGYFELTERDREIIQHVHRHRFLRSSHIVSLVGGSEQQVLRRLQLLYHHGYLERPPAQIEYYHEGGSRRIAYGLGNKGAALLRRDLNLPELKWNEKNRSIGRFFLEHALLISDVMVAVELACRNRSDIRLLSQDELPIPAETRAKTDPFRWHVNVSSRMNCGVIPDKTFAFEFSNGQYAFCFLEADRGTMPVSRDTLTQSSFFRKLLSYEATWAQNIHRSRFGFHRFRVLTVTINARRVESLREACQRLERGHGLFLFTDAPSLLSSPDVLAHPWLNAKDGSPVTLCE